MTSRGDRVVTAQAAATPYETTLEGFFVDALVGTRAKHGPR